MHPADYVKAIHIISVVTWFAGLFYIVRLFVYHAEAEDKPDPDKSILQEQYKIMESRLWKIITTPSMIITVGTGVYMASAYQFWNQPWMHIKLAFVIGLLVYHHFCGRIVRQLKNNQIKYSSTRMRILNEVSTLFLVAIVFIVVLKSTLNWVYGVVGLAALMVVLMIAIKWYKRYRERRSE